MVNENLTAQEIFKRYQEEKRYEEIVKATEIQTLIFDKKVFSREEAIQWAKDHDFKSSSVDETSTSFRLRQRDPGDFREGSFRTIEITTGVKAVIGVPK